MPDQRTVQPGDLASHPKHGVGYAVRVWPSGSVNFVADRLVPRDVKVSDLTPLIPAEKLPALLESHAELVELARRANRYVRHANRGFAFDDEAARLSNEIEAALTKAQEITREQ